MNKALLASYMARASETQGALARAMGLSLSRLNAKINEARGAAFTQSEIAFIAARYGISNDDACLIFFPREVASDATS